MSIRHLDSTILSVAQKASRTGGRVRAVRFLKDERTHQRVRVVIDLGPAEEPDDGGGNSVPAYFLNSGR